MTVNLQDEIEVLLTDNPTTIQRNYEENIVKIRFKPCRGQRKRDVAEKVIRGWKRTELSVKGVGWSRLCAKQEAVVDLYSQEEAAGLSKEACLFDFRGEGQEDY